MNSITIKNLWARKKQNAWIFIELIVFTFVTWMVIEPVVKDSYRRLLPRGYEPERMIVLDVDFPNPSLRKPSEYYIEQLKTIQGVERATAVNYDRYSDQYAIGSLGWLMVSEVNGDTAALTVVSARYDLDYFNTHGMLNVKGNKVDIPDRDKIVVSRSFAESYMGGVDVIGKEVRLNCPRLSQKLPGFDWSRLFDREFEIPFIVADVIEDVRFCAAEGPTHSSPREVFVYDDENKVFNRFLLRLKSGVNLNKFIEVNKPEIERMLCSDDDNAMLAGIDTAEECNKAAEREKQLVQPIQTRKILVVFFLLNLILGVVGTFWLQAKKRSEEMGIVMAFGARRIDIVWSYLKEGWVMFTVAFVVAACIYFNFAIYDAKIYEENSYYADPTIVDKFWSCFILDASIVYIIISTVLSVGIIIPTIWMLKAKVTVLLNKQ
ncbi:MAG: hypothetical protein MJZ18_07860 [Bacteroidales bacterium]|nr:hypothetical protein [Bacteroidales bacterium]